MHIPRSPLSGLRAVLVIALPAFFTVGGFGNLFASEAIAADYARWGYPGWFHLVTAALELLAAALMCSRATATCGALLGGAIMASAFATLMLHGEPNHAIAPAAIGAAIALRLWLDAWIKRARWEGRPV